MFRLFSNYAAIVATAAALTLTAMPASASQAVQRFNQPEQRDGTGRRN